MFSFIYTCLKTTIPITDDAIPPGAPTVDSAGPLFPALDTNIIPCLSTISFIRLITQLR